MGLSYNTYRNNIDHYLEKLENHAEFEKIYGGVIITKIYYPIYNKKLAYENDLLFLKEIIQCNEGLSSIAGMGRKYKHIFNDANPSTIWRILSKSRDKLFGTIDKQSRKNESCNGIAGTRKYVWAIKLSDLNEYRFMTQEEEAVFDALIKDVYSNLTPEEVKQAGILKERLKDKSLTQEEYEEQEKIQDLDFFNRVLVRFEETTGFKLVCVNQYMVFICYALSGEDAEYRNRLFKAVEEENLEK